MNTTEIQKGKMLFNIQYPLPLRSVDSVWFNISSCGHLLPERTTLSNQSIHFYFFQPSLICLIISSFPSSITPSPSVQAHIFHPFAQPTSYLLFSLRQQDLCSFLLKAKGSLTFLGTTCFSKLTMKKMSCIFIDFSLSIGGYSD